jgi:hypothetical protein
MLKDQRNVKEKERKREIFLSNGDGGGSVCGWQRRPIYHKEGLLCTFGIVPEKIDTDML